MASQLVVANWKMHGSVNAARQLIASITEDALSQENVDVVVCPPAIYLPVVKDDLKTGMVLGAQDVCALEAEQGAFTGEVSAAMLDEFNCRFVIVGHSERRAYFKESTEILCGKIQHALSFGLTPIFCIGEPLESREVSKQEQFVASQIDEVLAVLGSDVFAKLVLAYEPIWAIGTGKTATPIEAQAMHAFIRQHLENKGFAKPKEITILYGGSVNDQNAQSLFGQPDIDGALVGGASLDGNKFSQICMAAGNL